MCGTAAEVTPIRSVDDHEIGVGRDHDARSRRRTSTPCGATASAGPSGSTTCRSSQDLDAYRDRSHQPQRAVDRRARRGARARGAALRLALARADGAALRGAARRRGRRAVRAAVSSGTAGLHLCMRLAGVGPGDEVITSPYSFVASANCAIYEGATPVFADIDPHTLNLDPAAVEAAITPRTKALVAVDIFGYPCRVDALIAALRTARARARRGLVRGARCALQGQAARLARSPGGVGVLSQQADDDR